MIGNPKDFDKTRERYEVGDLFREAVREALVLRSKGASDPEIVEWFGYHPLREKLSDVVAEPDVPIEDRVVALYDSGKSVNDIRDELGIGWRQVQQMLASAGREMRPPGKRPEKDAAVDARVVELYDAGKGMDAIGAELEIGWSRIRRILAEAGREIRPRGWQKGTPGPRKKNLSLANPQLQVFENGADPVEDLANAESGLDHPGESKFREFHRGGDPTKVLEYETEVGDETHDLVVLGRCPAVSWQHGRCSGCREHVITDVHESEGSSKKEDFRFEGHREPVRGAWLACDPDGLRLFVVAGDVAKLRRHGDELGEALFAEYVVDSRTVPGSGKDGHYVHQLGPSLPTLRWHEGVSGYEFVGGSKFVSDWIHG